MKAMFATIILIVVKSLEHAVQNFDFCSNIYENNQNI